MSENRDVAGLKDEEGNKIYLDVLQEEMEKANEAYNEGNPYSSVDQAQVEEENGNTSDEINESDAKQRQNLEDIVLAENGSRRISGSKDLMFEIFKYMDARECARMRAVCRDWCTFLAEDAERRRIIGPTIFGRPPPSAAEEKKALLMQRISSFIREGEKADAALKRLCGQEEEPLLRQMLFDVSNLPSRVSFFVIVGLTREDLLKSISNTAVDEIVSQMREEAEELLRAQKEEEAELLRAQKLEEEAELLTSKEQGGGKTGRDPDVKRQMQEHKIAKQRRCEEKKRCSVAKQRSESDHVSHEKDKKSKRKSRDYESQSEEEEKRGKKRREHKRWSAAKRRSESAHVSRDEKRKDKKSKRKSHDYESQSVEEEKRGKKRREHKKRWSATKQRWSESANVSREEKKDKKSKVGRCHSLEDDRSRDYESDSEEEKRGKKRIHRHYESKANVDSNSQGRKLKSANNNGSKKTREKCKH